MSYFAVAALHGPHGWGAQEVDLRDVGDVEDAAHLLRDLDVEADVSLLFVEGEDEYLVILRLDEGEDLRVFGSDAVYADESRLGEALLGDLETEPVLDLDIEEAEETEDAEMAEVAEPELPASAESDGNPLGDADLLADLGIPAAQLLDLCTQEGMLPSDVTAAICEKLGCAEIVEELRTA